MQDRRTVQIHTPSIALGALLKWAGVVSTGGEAKRLVADQRVFVNGQIETRRGRRLVSGDRVAVQGGPILVVRTDDASPPQALAPGLP